MKTNFTHWQEADGTCLGFLNEYPDHWTQGSDLEDLKENLIDIYKTFTTESIAGIRKVSELEIA